MLFFFFSGTVAALPNLKCFSVNPSLLGNNCSCQGEISLGPWGYHTGKEWSFRPTQAGGGGGGGGIKQIIIRYGGVINSVMFKGGGDGDYSIKFGGEGGDKTAKIDIDFPSEFLTGMSGTHGLYFRTFGYNVCSLSFETNKKKYGPYGSGSGTAFSVNANDGVITGFHGRHGQYLEAIGVYIMPACSLSTEFEEIRPSTRSSVPRGAGPRGGGGGREWDDGVFSGVKGVHVRLRADTGVVSAVRFGYLKSDGSIVLSPFHGGGCSGDVRNMTIEFGGEGEYLIGVEGFYGAVAEASNTVITSLTFITNKAKYGPVGEEMGTFFTFMNSGEHCNGKVVGFHGRSGAYLDAIGLHTEYLSLS